MFDTKELTIGEDTYTLKKFPTVEGLRIRREFMQMIQSGDPLPPVEFQVKVITMGATVNSIQIDQKKFESHFRGKYDAIDQLFSEILEFNFNFSEVASDQGKGTEESPAS